MLKQSLLLAEKGWLPDSLVRFGIRQLLKKRLDEIKISEWHFDIFAG